MPTRTLNKDRLRKKQQRDERRQIMLRMEQLALPHPRKIRQKYDAQMENGDGFDNKPMKKNKRLSKRMLWMSQPKYQNQKYQAPPSGSLVKCTCLVTERPVSTRLEHLSLPLVRTLVPAKEELKPILSKGHFKNIVVQLSKSLRTIYSRIYNIDSSKPAKSKPAKRDPDKNKKIEEWCVEHSKPKQYESEEVIRLNQHTSLTEEDFDRLSTPKHTVQPFEQRKPVKCSDPIVPIKKTVLEFEPTPNLVALATPKVPPEAPDFEQYQNPFDIPRDYRKIKTAGYKTLASPKNPRKRFVKAEQKEETFEISPNALKCKPSEGTKQLAVPKKDLSEPPRPGFIISKAALKKLKPDKEQYFAKLATARSNKS